MKIGDKVRFISEVGGGKVAGFQGKDIVLVEDEDGFQIPTRRSDVVVVGGDDYDIGKVHSALPQNKQYQTQTVVKDPEPADFPVTYKPKVEERKGGDTLSVYLAFVPVDVHTMSKTNFEAYLVNDSNYYVRYTYLTAEGNSYHLRATAEVEPNTKEFIEEFDRGILQELEHIAIQLVAFKRDKTFLLKPTIDVQLRIDPVKFYKVHTFQENDFFEEPALIYTIVENDRVARPLVIDAHKLKEEMYQSVAQQKKRSTSMPTRVQDKNSPVVVDLHASVILETTAGMSHTDILNYQLDCFHKTIAQYAHKKGTKIVFIHGKGEGVLRQSIIHELRYRYKNYTYQDASFQEYGYGATQITIK